MNIVLREFHIDTPVLMGFDILCDKRRIGAIIEGQPGWYSISRDDRFFGYHKNQDDAVRAVVSQEVVI